MGGQAMEVNNKMGFGYHFGVLDDSAGWKKVESTISKIAMDVNAGGVNINYDSDQPLDTSNVVNSTVGKVFNALKGSQFIFTMNDKGEIGSVSGINELIQKMMDAVPGAGAMANGMSSAFNENSFKQNIQQAFGMYPGKPVKPGDSWTNTMSVDNNGVPMKLDNTYTLESVNGDNANVKVNSKISSDGAAGYTMSGTMTGAMMYDVPTGVPVDGNLDMKIDMNISGQAAPLNMDIVINMKGKKS
jgi:hypothetical protein